MRAATIASLVVCSAVACASEPRAPDVPARPPEPTGSVAEVAAAESAGAPLSAPPQAVVTGASATASSAPAPGRPESDEELAKRCAEQHPKPYPVIAGEDSSAPADPLVHGSLSAIGSGSSGGAAKTVSAMAPAFRRCFVRGIACDPDMRGSARIAAKIDAEGRVASATPIKAKGLSKGVLDCLVGVVSERTFDKPEGGGATIVIPVVFVSAG